MNIAIQVFFFGFGLLLLLAGAALVPAWIETGYFFSKVGAGSFQGIVEGLLFLGIGVLIRRMG